jgi:acyl-CoA synthetase (AMP-forming)/AMP-acid ligase II
MKAERIEDLLTNAAARWGKKTGLISVSDDRSFSFETWLDDATMFARWLLMRTGDTPGCVTLQANSSYSYAWALFGCFIAGKTMVPLGPKMDPQTLSFVLKDCLRW